MTSRRIVIAVDGMGGDHAPQSVLDGLLIAIDKYPDTDFLLFGDSPRIQDAVAKQPAMQGRVTVRHAPMVIPGDMKASAALRQGKESSMRLAIDAVASGEAHAVVSGGNTGALMAMSLFVLRPLPGIERPALASLFPTKGGDCVMLDLGANVECDSENLVQFAIMGATFSRAVVGIANPSVGLLNVGSEETKGKDSLREAAHQLKQATQMPWRFHGFVEGDDIPAGTVDVVVTDGFTGNVALKTAEGVGRLYSDFLKRIFVNASWVAKLGYLLAKPAFRTLRERTDPRRYNGGVFLGLQGVCVKSHGGMDGVGFANALALSHDLVRENCNETIKAELAMMSGLMNGTEAP